MRIALVVAVLIGTALPACAEGTQEFMRQYGKGEDVTSRLYLKGIGDGISAYNARMSKNKVAIYCPPDRVGIVDAQYALILRSFLSRYPNLTDAPIEVTLLFALEDAFPCR
jgi:hypothetical protein